MESRNRYLDMEAFQSFAQCGNRVNIMVQNYFPETFAGTGKSYVI